METRQVSSAGAWVNTSQCVWEMFVSLVKLRVLGADPRNNVERESKLKKHLLSMLLMDLCQALFSFANECLCPGETRSSFRSQLRASLCRHPHLLPPNPYLSFLCLATVACLFV